MIRELNIRPATRKPTKREISHSSLGATTRLAILKFGLILEFGWIFKHCVCDHHSCLCCIASSNAFADTTANHQRLSSVNWMSYVPGEALSKSFINKTENLNERRTACSPFHGLIISVVNRMAPTPS